MALRYETVCKGNIFVAEITEGTYGGFNLTIHRVKQGRKPKVCYTQHCNTEFDAKVEMDEYLPEVKWEER